MIGFFTLHLTPGDKFLDAFKQKRHSIAVDTSTGMENLMETRIRHFRKQRGWTLQTLADRIGTTAQTIQRLETSNMTVSTDWLERIAEAFGIDPVSLLASEDRGEISMLGTIGKGGIVRDVPSAADPQSITLDVPAEQPVAVRVDESQGPYAAGSILIANKLVGDDMSSALGRDALVALEGGTILLRRVVKGSNGTFTLVPLSHTDDIRYNQAVEWLAKIVMRVEYF